IHQAFSADGTDWSTPVVVGNASSPPFTFSISPSQGDGRYRFWSIAIDAAGNVESLAAKSPTGDAESGLDTATPLSALGPPTGYWQPSTPLSVSSIASDDGSGLASVQLFASYSADGVSWTAPASVGTRTSGPFEFTFGWTMGEGRYRFWSIATDVAGNVEAIGGKPTTGEFEVGIDRAAPSATVQTPAQYWHRAGPLALDVTASDDLSGVSSVALYVSFSSDGVSWSTPTLAATSSLAPFSFSYSPDHGDGTYRF